MNAINYSYKEEELTELKANILLSIQKLDEKCSKYAVTIAQHHDQLPCDRRNDKLKYFTFQ